MVSSKVMTTNCRGHSLIKGFFVGGKKGTPKNGKPKKVARKMKKASKASNVAVSKALTARLVATTQR